MFLTSKIETMLKKEVIWREILHETTKNKKQEFTQEEIAQKYGFSLSTIFGALKIPRAANLVRVSRGFEVLDAEKFLYLWATNRNLKNEIIYQTQTDKNIFQIEGEMPPEVIFTAFSAYRKRYNEAPSDYNKVYVYATEDRLEEIKKRFPLQKGPANIIILRPDNFLKNYGGIAPDVQVFVDLWNLSEWYAKDFLNALKEKMFNK